LVILLDNNTSTIDLAGNGINFFFYKAFILFNYFSKHATIKFELFAIDPELNNAIMASIKEIKDQDEDDLKRGINESLKETSPRSSAVGNDDNNNMAVVLYKADVNKVIGNEIILLIYI
jgi:hypothetical protein